MLSVILFIICGILIAYLVYAIISRILLRVFNYAPPVSASQSNVLDSRLRMIIQPPETILKRSGISSGMRLLDVGCGSGPYTIFMARAVGKDGLVYALDIQKDMLAKLEDKLALPQNKDIINVHPILADAANLPLEDNSLDLALIVSVTREFPDGHKVFKDIKRVLKPNGLLAVSEILIDMDYITRSEMSKLGVAAGFEIAETKGNLWSYTMKFKKLLVKLDD
jgi:ubiquinone/menaquinone biosynthesis C-methylase UbiE